SRQNHGSRELSCAKLPIRLLNAAARRFSRVKESVEVFAVANKKRPKRGRTRGLSVARFTEEDLTHFETLARIKRSPAQKFRSTLRAASRDLVDFLRARAGGEQREKQRRKGLSLISKGAEMLDPWQLHYLLTGFDLTDAVERNDRRIESALQAP